MSPELAALVEAVGLKRLPRAGWVRVGVASPESVAAHAWGVAWLVLRFLPSTLDLGRALAYAVLHDLPEVRVGDITPYDGVTVAQKHAREASAMAELLAPLPAHLRARWEAYEAQADDEARFVRQLDRLDMAIQAVAYSHQGHTGLEGFLDSAAKAVTHPALVPTLLALRAAMAAASAHPAAVIKPEG